MSALACTECDARYAFDWHLSKCSACGGTLAVQCDTNAPTLGRQSGEGVQHQSFLRRFAGVLPLPDESKDLIPAVPDGQTPLVPVPSLTRQTGIPQLFFKLEYRNPTGSFKDRGTALQMLWARASGHTAVGVVSSGNMGGSVAGYAATYGISARVVVPAYVSRDKLFTIGVYGARVVAVDGTITSIRAECEEVERVTGIPFLGPSDPLRIEGQKTTAYEIVDDLNGAPDRVFVPVSSGGHMTALLKGFSELLSAGAIQEMPAVFGVQASGCAPIARAFRDGTPMTPWGKLQTRAHALTNPDPPSGRTILRRLAELGRGGVITVDDVAMAEAQSLLAEHGLFVQAESAAALAACLEMAEHHGSRKSGPTVCVLTGSGLKDPGYFREQNFGEGPIALSDLKPRFVES